MGQVCFSDPDAFRKKRGAGHADHRFAADKMTGIALSRTGNADRGIRGDPDAKLFQKFSAGFVPRIPYPFQSRWERSENGGKQIVRQKSRRGIQTVSAGQIRLADQKSSLSGAYLKNHAVRAVVSSRCDRPDRSVAGQ